MNTKAKLYFYTPSGEKYNVTESGDIFTDKMPEPSGSWKMQGLSHVKMNWFIPFNQLTPEKIQSLPMLYKNGNPQFTVRDLDHGSTREWGNTVHHGVKRIVFPINS